MYTFMYRLVYHLKESKTDLLKKRIFIISIVITAMFKNIKND